MINKLLPIILLAMTAIPIGVLFLIVLLSLGWPPIGCVLAAVTQTFIQILISIILAHPKGGYRL